MGFAAQLLAQALPLPHYSVLFLAAVIASAALWGLGPSLLAAVLSVAAGSFLFYTPIYSFRVANPQDLADLAVFVVVAALTSRLAAGVRTQALEARRRQAIIGGLYAFSERLAASTDPAQLNAAILEHLAPVLGHPLYLLLPEDGTLAVAAASGGAEALPGEVLAAAGRVMAGGAGAPAAWRIERLATAQATVGVVAARPGGAARALDADHTRALLGQAAIAVERARLAREIAEARLKAQGNALREALVNSVSHELQTPLAAILGSATTLESFGEAADPGARRELVATIREEAERLGSYIGNVLDLTRIRSGQIAPRLELVELSDIIDAALRRKQRVLAGRELHLALAPDLPMLQLDLFLMEHAVANVLDNAAKYSPAGSRIDVAAAASGREVVLEVTDRGSGIRGEDLERVFEAFYRGPSPPGRPAAGTGLGLAICRAFVEANAGTVTAASAATGTTIRMLLPIPAADG